MVPYRGRLAFRIARLILALACGAWYARAAGLGPNWVTAVLAAYAVYAVGSLFEVRFDTPLRSATAIVADATYFAVWTFLAPEGWEASLACGYFLASAVLLHDLFRACIATGVAMFIALVLPSQDAAHLAWAVAAMGSVAVSTAVYKNYLQGRMSNTLRHNVIIRSQAENARDAERQRIAADFHDGPLQSFISFQMRLEIVKKLLARDVATATLELRQLQELCQSQVADLRSFVRSMRPADEGMSLAASLSRMAELFLRDSGISASFSAGDIYDPAETEVSLEVLQIVREALNNIQKHSGASRVAIAAGRKDRRLEITVEDNGGGFPFTGSFSLEELDLMRLGPGSIKRRIRMLGGELTVDSKPGEGAKLAIRIPL